MATLADLSQTSASFRTRPQKAWRPRLRRGVDGSTCSKIDLLRIVAIVAVVGTHVVIFTQPQSAVGAQALTVLLHVSRCAFFFITAFVLYLTSGWRPVPVLRFWRKRFPPVLIPYLAWTAICWQYDRLFSWVATLRRWRPRSLSWVRTFSGAGPSSTS